MQRALGDPNSSSKRLPRALLGLLRLAVAAIVLAYLFSKVPISEVATVLSGVELVHVVAGLLAALVLQLPAAYRLKELTEPHELAWSTFEIFEINAVTRFYGLFLPGGSFTGAAIRFYKLSSVQKDYAGAGVAIFSDRMAATTTLCIIGIAFWLVDQPAGSLPWLLLMLVALSGLMVLTVLFFRGPSLVLSPLRQGIGRFGGHKLRSWREALSQLRAMRTGALVRIVALSFLAHLVGILSYYLLAGSLGLDLSMASIAWIRSAVILVTMIPITASGVGLREGAMLLALHSYGIGSEEALAFSLLVFGITILAFGLLGGLFEARRFLR